MKPDFYEGCALSFGDRRKFYKVLLDGLYHMLIVGPTRVGKSKLVQALIQHLAQKSRATIFLLDPGANTARQVELWAFQNRLKDRLTIMDPNEQDFFLGFNPLAPVPSLPISLQSKFVQEAILTALEIDQKDSVYYMPILEQSLYFLARALMETGYTFTEAQYLLSAEANPKAAALIEQLKSESVQQYWLGLQRAKPRERQQLLGITQARLLPFLTSKPIQAMTSQRERVLDFSDYLESGKIFLANLEAGSSLSVLDAKLLANLLISSIVRACFSRPAYTGKEVYLIIEECGEGLIGTEIGKMLRRAGKQKLRVILLNQDLSSMMAQNPSVFWQVWANTSHKVAFGGLPFEDLEILALEFFGEEFDLKELKDQILRTYFEPQESTRTIFHSSSMESYGETEGEGESGFESRGEVFLEDEGLILTNHRTLHLSQGTGKTGSRSHTFSSSSGSSSGQSQVPFYEFLKKQELSSQEFYNLEELRHLGAVKLKSLQKRRMALKKRGQPVAILEVPYIPELAEPEDLKKQRESIFKQSQFYATIEEIEQEQERRERSLSS